MIFRTASPRFVSLASVIALSLISLSAGTGIPVSAQPQSVGTPTPTNSPQENALVTSNTQFALKLYQNTVNAATGNFLFSPYSISEALALADAGARGNTDSQIRAALNTSLSQADLSPALLSLRTDLLARGNQGDDQATAPATSDPNATPARSLRIANALWGDQTFPFDKTYTDLISANFNGALHPVDFIGASEASRQAINDWVAQQTADHIKDIMPPGSVSGATRLVLVNAIYFHNGWAYHPDPQSTSNAPFTTLDSATPVQVPMMLMTPGDSGQLNYLKGSNYQAVEVPYAGNFGSMLIILPDAGHYAAVEKALDPALFNTITSGLTSQAVRLTMPRFTFSTALDLGMPMKSFGLIDAFDPQAADFSGMGPKGLYIQAMLHKAFIGVDENGTVAAAATGIGMGVTSVREYVRVDVNRPFIFAIRDPQTGMILFMGRVLNPLG